MTVPSTLDITVSSLGERLLIERIRARLSMPSWVVVGPGDDAAVLRPVRGEFEVFTTDAVVDGVHVDRRFVPPDAIGHRALAVNLSDLAAMGAEPRAALLSLALPASSPVALLDGLLDGLLALAAEHRVTLIGGNLTSTPGPLMVDVTAIGSVRPRRILTRVGARPGDEIYVTGSLGDAAAGLDVLVEACAGGGDEPWREPSRVCQRYLRPTPRVRAGLLLGRNRVPTSCMDLSDGLADGVRQMAQASDVGMTIDLDALPIADDVRQWYGRRQRDPVAAVLAGGDDYELLFTVRPGAARRLRGVRQALGDLPITRIGVVTRAREILVRSPSGTTTLGHGFEHFS